MRGIEGVHGGTEIKALPLVSSPGPPEIPEFGPEFGPKLGVGAVTIREQDSALNVRQAERLFDVFGPAHQARLPRELALAGIHSIEAANRYLEHVYRPAYNADSRCPRPRPAAPMCPISVRPWLTILCEQFERTVGRDNCVSVAALTLQIPADRHRHHYVKAKVRVHRYVDGCLAIFHGPRKLAHYDAAGKLMTEQSKQAA